MIRICHSPKASWPNADHYSPHLVFSWKLKVVNVVNSELNDMFRIDDVFKN